jgi:hypothetical protein
MPAPVKTTIFFCFDKANKDILIWNRIALSEIKKENKHNELIDKLNFKRRAFTLLNSNLTLYLPLKINVQFAC